ncbi:hypothetical protein PAJL_1745 [Cutibacterium acnes HL042PA3]|nr:hypothetical protein TIIST44_02515 [Cutibacterium acnes subsp. defendens ATCC 11828]ESK58909.1 hypothetical protein PAJL_1745 [Cutibacterium acnes HL042PA3]KFC15515.1 hypothetical protein PAST2_00310 [Cutibacterium acnes HL202PA1]MCM4180211.1 hypothetical protein [Cutibacterium acnes P15]
MQHKIDTFEYLVTLNIGNMDITGLEGVSHPLKALSLRCQHR